MGEQLFVTMQQSKTDNRDALERARATAQSSESLFRAVFDNAMDAILIADDDLRYLDANPAACRLFGVSRDELVGRKIDEFGTPIKFHSVQNSWQSFQQTGHQHGEFTLVRPGGEVKTLEYTAVASFLPGQHLSVLRDVTIRKKQDEERDQLLAREHVAHLQAEEETRLREKLLSIVGHDLRNPLGAIRATAQLLLSSSGLGPADQRKVQRIVGSTDRMARLISQLLDFSSVRMGGGLAMEMTETNLNRVCEEVIEELRLGNPKHEIQFRAPGALVGHFDPDRMAEMFSNVIGNAIQYGQLGSPVVVTLGSSKGGMALIEVHNWGDPIRPDVLPHIFDSFRRGREDRSNSVGLGLYIVKQIVLAHGGHIEVFSSAEEGTRFAIHLPLAAKAEPAAAASATLRLANE